MEDLQPLGEGHDLVQGGDEAGGQPVDGPDADDAPVGRPAVGEDNQDQGLPGMEGEGGEGDGHGGGDGGEVVVGGFLFYC